jgi:hypothetical protein
MLGVFMVMLLVMPGLAEPDAKSSDIYAATGGSGVANTDTQSPVLDGSAFTNYDTVFLHGTMAETGFSYNVVQESKNGYGYTISLFPTGLATINCPFVSYDSKQGGIYPAVRYLGLQYYTSGAAQILSVGVYNGALLVKTISFTPPLKSPDDYTVHIINLGEWIRFNRGLNMEVTVHNPSLTDTGGVYIGGYGARFEW